MLTCNAYVNDRPASAPERDVESTAKSAAAKTTKFPNVCILIPIHLKYNYLFLNDL